MEIMSTGFSFIDYVIGNDHQLKKQVAVVRLNGFR